MLLSKNLTIFTVLTIILCYQYYNTEDFSSISIIVMLNITIHDNIVILPSPNLSIIKSGPSEGYVIRLIFKEIFKVVIINIDRICNPLSHWLRPGDPYMYMMTCNYSKNRSILSNRTVMILLYSQKILRAPIFEDFLLTSKILSSKYFWLLDKSIIYGQTLAHAIYQVILMRV